MNTISIARSSSRFILFFLFIFSFANASQPAKEKVKLYSDKTDSSAGFSVKEIKLALQEKGLNCMEESLSSLSKWSENDPNIILLNLENKDHFKRIEGKNISKIKDLKSEGFLIYKSSPKAKTIWIIGYDAAGLMYGGLEVAELIKVSGLESVGNQFQNPYMKERGIKYNIPLDMRSPTYTEPSDAAQNNMDEVWNLDYWKEYIDYLARYRYNLVSLWNMHPFPSMVKVPEYPEVALNDVRRSTGIWKENYSLNGWGFDAPEIMKSYEVVKTMTIEQKIDFWRKVMAYGKERNVKFYMVTWNIFTYGIDGKYGITDKVENPKTADYFRKSVKQMLLTYPDLGGIGLTTGENMYEYSAEQKEQWAYATYGQGVLDALKEQPNRKIDFIHRQHQSKANEITKIFKEIIQNKNINFVFSFKYAQAHVYSSTKQVFHDEFVKDIQSENVKTLWTLRNDDNFYFRWGAPNFVREFIKNIPKEVSEGFYYGSDQYVWGKDFLTKNNSGNPEFELNKHWYQWMSWGRLGYNPDLDNSRFVAIIQSRFPTIKAQEMFEAWQSASMIYPLVTGFHWGALDFQWYIESGQSQPSVSKTPSGYHDLNSFINLKPHGGTDNIAIPAYVKGFLSNAVPKGTTPLQLADEITTKSDAALSWANSQNNIQTEELRFTIDDIKSMSYLGKYYAHKIKAATYLALFRETFAADWQKKCIEELNLSASNWRNYTALGISNYKNPLWTNRVGYVDWKKNFDWTVYEITSNGGKVNLTSMEPSQGGTILEAEDVVDNKELIETKLKGFTGKGYAGNGNGHATQKFAWNYNATSAGKYILEFRYTLNREDVFQGNLAVNGDKSNEIQFWNCGNIGNWVWERITVDLKKGSNTISVTPERFVLLDHLNVIKK
jgi:hypothetical protein